MHRWLKPLLLFIVSYSGAVAAIWGSVEAYTYFTESKLREILGLYWIPIFYGVPFVTATIAVIVAFRSGRFAEVAVQNSSYDLKCGDKAIDLADQRLMVAIAFGSYFTTLLESENNYVFLDGQMQLATIESRREQSDIERLMSALQDTQGPRTIVLCGEGGMGKSTLAAKIVRCLIEREATDVILGDSAKEERVDPLTGAVERLQPGFYDVDSFVSRLATQLSIPMRGNYQANRVIAAIKDRLAGRRAVVVLDNLENVRNEQELLQAVHSLTNRDVRAVVTTRSRVTHVINRLGRTTLIVNFRPINNLEEIAKFLRWHIEHQQSKHPALARLASEMTSHRRLQRLLERTGGIPLLLQLVLSDIARFGWDWLDRMPQIFGQDLLKFLYKARWEEFASLGDEGLTARQLLKWLAREQQLGRKVNLQNINDWASNNYCTPSLTGALRLLDERFLLIQSNLRDNSFAIFPTLAQFVENQSI